MSCHFFTIAQPRIFAYFRRRPVRASEVVVRGYTMQSTYYVLRICALHQTIAGRSIFVARLTSRSRFVFLLGRDYFSSYILPPSSFFIHQNCSSYCIFFNSKNKFVERTSNAFTMAVIQEVRSTSYGVIIMSSSTAE